MPDESEKFSLAQMQDAFDIQRVSLGGPVFDVEKAQLAERPMVAGSE